MKFIIMEEQSYSSFSRTAKQRTETVIVFATALEVVSVPRDSSCDGVFGLSRKIKGDIVINCNFCHKQNAVDSTV